MTRSRNPAQAVPVRMRIGLQLCPVLALLVLAPALPSQGASGESKGDSGDTGRTYRFTREYALDGSWGEAGRSPSILAGADAGPLVLADASPTPAEAPTPRSLASLTPVVKPQLMVWGFRDMGRFVLPQGIAFDPADGSIAVANSGDHRIEFFSAKGRPLLQIVHRVDTPDGKQVDGIPCALAYDRAGRLLVVDNAARYVDVLDRRGRSVARLGIPAGRASAVTATRSGVIHVGTTGVPSTVYRFQPDYKPAGSWGVSGAGPGQLTDVTALGELPGGDVAVTCARGKYGIQVFTSEGAYVRGFGIHDLAPGNVSLPTGIIGTEDGRIWVSDEIRQSIEVFTMDGEYIGALYESGSPQGDFSYPSALATDGKGLIAVTERGDGRVQVMSISHHEEVSSGEKP